MVHLDRHFDNFNDLKRYDNIVKTNLKMHMVVCNPNTDSLLT